MEELTPLTREEEILNTLLSASGGGSVEDLSPETRKEQWYQNALDAINGNELTYDLAAEWRREKWYTKLIEALQAGGGGGGGEPPQPELGTDQGLLLLQIPYDNFGIMLNLRISGTGASGIVDWGDGSQTDTVSASNASVAHT